MHGARNVLRRWWWLHWFINFFISAPIVYAALAMAVSANDLSHYPLDHHKVAFLLLTTSNRPIRYNSIIE